MTTFITDIASAGALFAVFQFLHKRRRNYFRAAVVTTVMGIAALALGYVIEKGAGLPYPAINAYTVAFSAMTGLPGALAVHAYNLILS